MSPKEDWKDDQGHCKAKATVYKSGLLLGSSSTIPAPYKPHYTDYEPGNMEGSVLGKTKDKIHSFSIRSLPWVTGMTDQTITTPEAYIAPC